MRRCFPDSLRPLETFKWRHKLDDESEAKRSSARCDSVRFVLFMLGRASKKDKTRHLSDEAFPFKWMGGSGWAVRGFPDELTSYLLLLNCFFESVMTTNIITKIYEGTYEYRAVWFIVCFALVAPLFAFAILISSLSLHSTTPRSSSGNCKVFTLF